MNNKSKNIEWPSRVWVKNEVGKYSSRKVTNEDKVRRGKVDRLLNKGGSNDE
jgi:hypothetical protein